MVGRVTFPWYDMAVPVAGVSLRWCANHTELFEISHSARSSRMPATPARVGGGWVLLDLSLRVSAALARCTREEPPARQRPAPGAVGEPLRCGLPSLPTALKATPPFTGRPSPTSGGPLVAPAATATVSHLLPGGLKQTPLGLSSFVLQVVSFYRMSDDSRRLQCPVLYRQGSLLPHQYCLITLAPSCDKELTGLSAQWHSACMHTIFVSNLHQHMSPLSERRVTPTNASCHRGAGRHVMNLVLQLPALVALN